MRILKKLLPRRWLRSVPDADAYHRLYEHHAARHPEDTAVGLGSYEVVGEVELDVLRAAGLQPHHTLVDFGCGSGRLAMHAIPYLKGGKYIGIDIAPTFLRQAKRKLAEAYPQPPCQVAWLFNKTTTLPLDDHSADMICAFSVFTHMEHEDMYRYLVDALRVVRPGGRFVFSCLPLDLKYAQTIFQLEAAKDLQKRWSHIRSVVTTVDFMSMLARMAGWKVQQWYTGDVANIRSAKGEMRALGQSTCFLEAA